MNYYWLYSQGFAPAAGPLDIQCWIADLPKYMSEGTRFFGACAKPTCSGMGCRCVSCHDFGALGADWEKFKMVQRLEGGLGRVRRQFSGGREEPKRSPRGGQEEPKRCQKEPKGGQEEPKRRPRGAQEEPKRSQEEAKRNQE